MDVAMKAVLFCRADVQQNEVQHGATKVALRTQAVPRRSLIYLRTRRNFFCHHRR